MPNTKTPNTKYKQLLCPAIILTPAGSLAPALWVAISKWEKGCCTNLYRKLANLRIECHPVKRWKGLRVKSTIMSCWASSGLQPGERYISYVVAKIFNPHRISTFHEVNFTFSSFPTFCHVEYTDFLLKLQPGQRDFSCRRRRPRCSLGYIVAKI